ncbi:hypothetical protein AVEN_61349-1 [Araneus ventricosus]|uniref:Uncharacterized protein n=1 Tax=Araneus ventricosus TaxID=182803 RepID=A0A4Y2MGF4_ARAVE|nr:hypothetical protein AVEN_61349-1 [Araneus ventricosus]
MFFQINALLIIMSSRYTHRLQDDSPRNTVSIKSFKCCWALQSPKGIGLKLPKSLSGKKAAFLYLSGSDLNLPVSTFQIQCRKPLDLHLKHPCVVLFVAG